MAISFKEKLAYINKYAKGNDKLVKAVQLGKALEKVKDDTQREKIKKAVNDAFTQIKKINTASSTKTSTAKTAQTKQDKIEKEIEKFKKSIGRSKWITATRYMTNSGLRKTTIEKDAQIPALPKGKRISRKTGKPYWENRANRSDVKQPPVDYPKLARGGYIEIDKLYFIGTPEVTSVDKNGRKSGDWKYIVVDENGNKRESILKMKFNEDPKDVRANTENAEYVTQQQFDRMYDKMKGKMAKGGTTQDWKFEIVTENSSGVKSQPIYVDTLEEVEDFVLSNNDYKSVVVTDTSTNKSAIFTQQNKNTSWLKDSIQRWRNNRAFSEAIREKYPNQNEIIMIESDKFSEGGQTDENFKVGDKIKVLGDSYTILSFRVDKSQGYEEKRVIMKNDKGETLSYPLDMVIAYSKYADGGQIGSGKNGYVAFYKGKRIEVYADTMYQAQQLAAKHFKAKKEWEVNVVLAEVDGKPYVQSTAFAKGGEIGKFNGKPFSFYKYDTKKVKIAWKGKIQPFGAFYSVEDAIEELKKHYQTQEELREYSIVTPDGIIHYGKEYPIKYAKGGMIEHGLKKGDLVVNSFYNGVFVENDGKTYVVNLNTGKRYEEDEFMEGKSQDIIKRANQ